MQNLRIINFYNVLFLKHECDIDASMMILLKKHWCDIEETLMIWLHSTIFQSIDVSIIIHDSLTTGSQILQKFYDTKNANDQIY